MKRTILPTYCLMMLFAFMPYANGSAAINVRSWHLSAENGLGANYIRSIVQDSRGYIWMGATTGLIRYDGYTSELITHEDMDDRRLMLDERVQMVDLWQGRFVWVMVRGNKYCCYDTQTDQFVDYTGDGSYEESYRHSYLLGNGDIWLSDEKKGCKIIHFDGKTFSNEKRDIGEQPEEARLTLPKQYEHLLTSDRELIKDNRGNLVVVSKQGELWHISQKTNTVTHLSGIYSQELLRLNGSPRYSVVTDHDGIIWVSTYGYGLFVHDPQTHETTHFLNSGMYIAPIQTNYLLKLYEDGGGNIWACQENMGVVVISKQNAHTESVYFTSHDRLDHTNSIHLLARAGEHIYIGNRYNSLKIADGELNVLKTVDSFNDDVVAVCADRQGTIWMGTRASGVYAGQLNLRNQAGDDTSLSKGKISDIVCDKEGRVWISIFDGGVDLARPDGKGGYTFRHFFTGNDAVRHPRKMLVDHGGFLWLCSDEGVYTFNPDKLIADRKAYAHFDIGKEKQAKTNEVHCIFEDSNHFVMAGTAGNGVAEFDNSHIGSPVYTRDYITDDGLSDNNIQQIIEDDQKRLWFGTDHGLVRFDRSHQTFMNCMPASTLQGNMFIENAVCRLANGKLAFGSRHGIAVIDAKHINPLKSLFQLRVTDVKVNGVSIPYTEDEISLSHNENSLTFYFSDFVFEENHNPKFTYCLEGYDKDWSPMSVYNFASYKNLPSGKYTMRVRARNSFGEWNDTDIQMSVTIRPPLWATWWAYLLYFFILVFWGFTIYRQIRRMNALRNRIKVEKQLTEFKLQFFTNISHEFRTPLTIIRGAMERIRSTESIPGNLKQPLYSMQKSSDRLMRMINQLLEFSKMHNDKLQLAVEETEVVGFLRDIFNTFKEMAETKRISYQFTTNARTVNTLIDRSFLDKIAYNLISNAFKYTPSHHDIAVRVRQEDDSVKLIVEDTGIGIPKDKQKELFERFNQSSFSRDSIGIGLHLTNELVRVHHGTIRFEENPHGGSIFIVSIPTSPDVYAANEFMQTDNAVAIEEEENSQSRIDEVYREVSPIPLNEYTILVVEDDSDVRDFLVQELQRYFLVDSANDGAEALEKIGAEKPSLIVTDALMPIMNGFELVRRIRHEKEWADIPVVMLTALNSEADEIKGLKAGAEAYIRKPFSPSVLITRITRLLEQRENLKITYAKEVVGNVNTPGIVLEEQDFKLKKQLDAWLMIHLSDSQITVDSFAESLGYGRSKFYKKMKQLTGMTPNDYIRTLRMEKAIELMKDDRLTIAEIAYKVGYADQYYFSKAFKKQFGVAPTRYRKGES